MFLQWIAKVVLMHTSISPLSEFHPSLNEFTKHLLPKRSVSRVSREILRWGPFWFAGSKLYAFICLHAFPLIISDICLSVFEVLACSINIFLFVAGKQRLRSTIFDCRNPGIVHFFYKIKLDMTLAGWPFLWGSANI